MQFCKFTGLNYDNNYYKIRNLGTHEEIKGWNYLNDKWITLNPLENRPSRFRMITIHQPCGSQPSKGDQVAQGYRNSAWELLPSVSKMCIAKIWSEIKSYCTVHLQANFNCRPFKNSRIFTKISNYIITCASTYGHWSNHDQDNLTATMTGIPKNSIFILQHSGEGLFIKCKGIVCLIVSLGFGCSSADPYPKYSVDLEEKIVSSSSINPW